MNKKIVSIIVFSIFSVLLTYYTFKDNSIPFQVFCNRIENKLSEIEKIKFKHFRNLGGKYIFVQDTIFTELSYNIFKGVKIYDNYKHRYCDLDELPKSYYEDFKEVKQICDDLDIYDLHKDSVNSEIEFIFDIKYIKTGTIPNWDRKNDSKKDDYDGFLVFDVNNELEKNTSFYKLKDKWYFEYHERRPL